MTKNNKNKKSSVYTNIKKNSEKSVPAIRKGLNKIGKTTSKLAVQSVPVIEKGVSTIYGTLATGFDIGVEGAKSVARGVNKFTKYSKSKKSKRGHTKTRRMHRR
jgi:hypothetical protein